MNSEDAFLQAALPEARILLHQRLLPYSIGHEMILRRIRNPLRCNGDMTVGSLFTAVFVCSNDYDGAWAGLNAPNIPDTFEKWKRICGPFDVPKLIKSFLAYVHDGMSCPELGQKKRGATPGAPFVLMLLNVLQGKLGFSRTDALNCPFGLARWHYCAYYEAEGSVKIRNNTLNALRNALRESGHEPMRVQQN